MIKFSVLGSGSKGNATYIYIDGHHFLVDCGFTKPGLKKRLAHINRNVDDIEGVFITHTHNDHIKPWIKSEGLVVTAPEKDGVAPETKTIIHPKVSKFDLSHDSPCVGYTFIDNDGNKLAIVSDTGCVPEEAIEQMFDCTALLIETNYDIDNLITCNYPVERVDRIASTNGHLRNECAAEVVEMVACDKLKYLVGIHLSSSNNHPDLARFCLKSAGTGAEVVISDQKVPTKLMVMM